MNDLKVYDTLVEKRSEGVQKYRFGLLRDGEEVTPREGSSYKLAFVTQESLVYLTDLNVVGGLLELSSSDITNLPAGVYRIEVQEVTISGAQSFYPSNRMVMFTIKQNARDLPEGAVSSLTLDGFLKEFEEQVKHAGGLDTSIDTASRTITIGGKSIAVPTVVDISNLASRDDLKGLVKEAELTRYATTESVDAKLQALGSDTKQPMYFHVDFALAAHRPEQENWDSWPFRFDAVDSNDLKIRRPIVGLDWFVGVDNYAAKFTGYTEATGEVWHAWKTSDMSKLQSLNGSHTYSIPESIDATIAFNFEKYKYHLVPGDLLIDSDWKIFSVSYCFDNAKCHVTKLWGGAS